MIKGESGQILVFAVVIVGIVLMNTLVIIAGSQIFSQNASHTLWVDQATNLAEAGIDKAIVALNTTGGQYTGESETFLGGGSYSVNVVSKNPTTFVIQATGFVPSKENPKAKKTIQIQASTGTGISFVYGLLIGEGGADLGNGSIINGSVYSNGNFIGGNNVNITGDAYVAGGVQPTADQENDCVGLNCMDFLFGKSINGEDRLNIAQGFKPSTSGILSKVSLKLKKIGSPSNITVRILADNNGVPDKTNVLTSGTLFASLVTSDYGFVDVPFDSTPNLSTDVTYWIVLDTGSLNSSNYWGWSSDSLQSYSRGVASWSSNWQARPPVWVNVLGDLGFKTWMGGVATSISMNNGSLVGGSVHANTINGVTINKDAYYQVITNSTVNGESYPGSLDPVPAPLPISESNISNWKNEAQNYGIIATEDINGCPSRLGPGKIDANVTTTSNCTIIITTPLWITKNLNFGNSAVFRMDSSLGSSSGIIIVEGTTVFQNGDNLLGTGVPGSYLTLLSTYNTQTQGGTAIDTGNSSITGILYAPVGEVNLANNANFKEVVAWKLNTGVGTILTYDSGLISTFFSAGPSGSYSLVKGTYQLK